ncbi:MAG: ATP-binding protein [Coriobacteriales bacterium]|nr:ATP-binding protein [Coriobacteriales bacterium]
MKRLQKAWFVPTFGVRPACLVGRDIALASLMQGLITSPGNPSRTTVISGLQGMGKTALLLEFGERAAEQGFIVARATPHSNMLPEIIQTLQMKGSLLTTGKRHKSRGLAASALGFSAGLTFNQSLDNQYGFKVKLSLLCDELAKYEQGVLILIDDMQASSEELRELIVAYQYLVGEEKDVAIAFALQPKALVSLADDEMSTFLLRAQRISLDALAAEDARAYFYRAFKALDKKASPETLKALAAAVQGYPYLLQLLGYRLLAYLGDDAVIDDEMVALALDDAQRSLVDTVFKPCLKPLSKQDVAFLEALAAIRPSKKVADAATRLKKATNYAQQYRLRLMEAGLIRTTKRGEVEFSLPYLAEYLGAEQVE